MALLYGLQVAREKDFHSIQLETDSSITVNEISKGSSSLCAWGSTISDICNGIVECESCVIRHVKRRINSFAHNMATL